VGYICKHVEIFGFSSAAHAGKGPLDTRNSLAMVHSLMNKLMISFDYLKVTYRSY